MNPTFRKLLASFMISKEEKSKEPHFVRPLFGGVADTITTTMVHPLDVLKVRLQIRRTKHGSLEMFRKIYNCEGLRGMYVGLSAAVLRQFTVTSTRFGVYNLMYTNYVTQHGTKPELREKMLIGITAGVASSFFACPCDLALVRMLSETSRDSEFLTFNHCYLQVPRRYRGVFMTLLKIVSEEGIRTLWKGATLTVARAIILSVVQIRTYSEVNNFLRTHQMQSTTSQYVFSSTVTSFAAAFFSLPIDTIKTRYLVRYQYNHSPSMILIDLILNEGLFSLYKGFLPYYIRMLHSTIFTMIIIDHFNEWYHEFHFHETPKSKSN